jgi:Ca-activated chloride channel family protein
MSARGSRVGHRITGGIMNRTLALYGLATATLVGAFFLVPRSPTTAPPAPEPEVVSARHPVTRLSSSDDVLSFDARIDRGFVGRSDEPRGYASEPLYLDIAVRAVDSKVRTPITAALVIDRSGSMAGDGIENARFSADRFIRRLENGDRLAIVSYATDVTVDFSLQTIDATTRSAALRTVARLEEGGGTNIEGGLQVASRVLERALVEGGVGRLIFVSDGRPTEGSRSDDTLANYASALRKAGITVSALGVGLDYNEDLMTRIAQEGGGRYHYLREPRHLAKILDDELAHATQVVARQATIALPTEFAGFRIESAPGQIMTSGTTTHILLGDLAAGEERHVLVVLSAPQVHGDRAFQIPGPMLSYRALDGHARALHNSNDTFRLFSSSDAAEIDESRRGDVTARVLQHLAAESLENAMRQYSSGDVSAAQAHIRETKTRLESANRSLKNKDVADELSNLVHVYEQTNARPSTSSDGAALMKEQKARAYGLRR